MNDVLTTTEAAAILHADRRTVLRWARLGRLPATTTPGGHLRFARADVENLPLTTGEFARRARVGRRTVVRWCESGHLNAHRRPGSTLWEIPASEALPARDTLLPAARPGGEPPEAPLPSGMARNPVIFAALKRAQKASEEEVFGGRPPKKAPRRKKTS